MSRARRGMDPAEPSDRSADFVDAGYDEQVDAEDESQVESGLDGLLANDSPNYSRRRRARSSRWKSALAVLVSLAVLVGGGYAIYKGASSLWERYGTVKDYDGAGGENVTVKIEQGATLTDIANEMEAAGVVKSAKAFLKAAEDAPELSKIQPGEYQMKKQMSGEDAVKLLLDPASRVTNKVTIREGLRNSEIATVIAETTGIPAAEVEQILSSGQGLELPTYANGKTEGFMFPNTYTYGATPTAAEILAQMPQQFSIVAQDLQFEQKAKDLGMSGYDAVTVASIIERESRRPEDGPMVAQVIYNRLKKGMPLQMDSTVHYANNDGSGVVTTTDDQRNIDSPYNTYKVTGLPPGAISNPGKNSLNAAVNPTSGDYLYFVTVNPETGETKFAATMEEHEKNVAEFQKWCSTNPGHC